MVGGETVGRESGLVRVLACLWGVATAICGPIRVGHCLGGVGNWSRRATGNTGVTGWLALIQKVTVTLL